MGSLYMLHIYPIYPSISTPPPQGNFAMDKQASQSGKEYEKEKEASETDKTEGLWSVDKHRWRREC